MKLRIKRFFQTDDTYKENITKYTKVDGIIAVVYYLIFMITYYSMGRVYVEKKIYLGITCNIGLAIYFLLFHNNSLCGGNCIQGIHSDTYIWINQE